MQETLLSLRWTLKPTGFIRLPCCTGQVLQVIVRNKGGAIEQMRGEDGLQTSKMSLPERSAVMARVQGVCRRARASWG